jgi:predicted ATPase
MSGRRQSLTRLRAPYLRRLTLLCNRITDRGAHPFNLPWLTDSFTLDFTAPVTIIIGENGTGKSTLVEAIAALAGYDEAGGGKGYRAVAAPSGRSSALPARPDPDGFVAEALASPG